MHELKVKRTRKELTTLKKKNSAVTGNYGYVSFDGRSLAFTAELTATVSV